jgi:hypothetical protein
MRKFVIFLLLTFLLKRVAQASDLRCFVQEIENGQTFVQELTVPETKNPHHSMQFFKMQKFSDYSGFIAIVNGITVIHLYNEVTGQAFTSHNEAGGTRYSRLQLLPGGEGNPAIIIECTIP